MKNIKINPETLVFIVAYITILSVPLSFDRSWMLPEIFGIKNMIAQVEHSFSRLLILGFDYLTFEWAPRINRPLSSYFEIIDFFFRSFLWRFVPPHPSLSLTWFFTLVACPLLMWKLMRANGFSQNSSILTLVIYLVNPAVLASMTMLFRPAKPMTNFAILLCLYLALKVTENNDRQKEFRFLVLFWFLLFFNAFWDETAILIFPSVVIFFPKAVFGDLRRLFGFTLMGLLVVFNLFFGLSRITELLGYPKPPISEYDPVKMIPNAFHASISLFPINTKLAIMDSLGLINPNLAPYTTLKLTLLLGWIGVFLLSIFFLKKLITNPKATLIHSNNWTFKATFSLIGALVFLNYVQVLGNWIWGLYYYGSYIAIFFPLFFVNILDKITSRPIRIISVICIMISSITIFNYTNHAYRASHFIKEYDFSPELSKLSAGPILSGMFSGEYNRFVDFPPPHTNTKSMIIEIWNKINKFECVVVPYELHFFTSELYYRNVQQCRTEK